MYVLNMATFSERLSELMLEKEIKSHELAAVIGVSTNTVNDWRRGRFQVFLSNALKLADFFGCSLDYLMGRTLSDTDFIPQPCPSFYPHFLTVLEKCGVTAYRMREESQIKGAYFNNWKKGSDPLMPTLIIAAEYLDVTLDYLVGRES